MSMKCKCYGWNSVLDLKSPGTPLLRVDGKCQVSLSGYKVEIKRAIPQGVNPAYLILELSITEPSDGADVITTIDVHYEESPPQHHYRQVILRSPCEGEGETRIDVEQVS
jgi:hypothetical protein